MRTQYEASTLTPNTVPTDPEIGYNLVKYLILNQVYAFMDQFGGNIEDLIGEANLTFVKTHNQFITGISARGKKITNNYATTIRSAVWYRLFDEMRLKVRREHLAKMVPIESIIDNIDETGFDVYELSNDARFVAALVLNPPDEITSNAEKKGGEYRNYRSAIRSFLQSKKWSNTKIEKVFNEIRSVLK